MQSKPGTKRFPALRSKIGDWHYYVTTLSFFEVANRVRPATDLITTPDMSAWIQRGIVQDRAKKIADYLINREQHFFPGIVVGVYLGEPTWYEVEVEDKVSRNEPAVGTNTPYELGLLELDGTERLYAIDGQHRIAGIREALARLKDRDSIEHHSRLAEEDIAVLFVSADIEREGQLERVRRLFTTLNKEAKKVSDAEIVALDEDDAAAIVTRWIATRYEGFRPDLSANERDLPGLIQLGTRDEIPRTNLRSVTTIVSLYRMTKGIFQTEIKQLNNRHHSNRPEEEELETIYQEAIKIWELMREEDQALRSVMGTDPSEQRAASFRSDYGGHILFRPMGLQSFGRALGLLRTRGIDTSHAVKGLCKVPMLISQVPWVNVVWNPNVRRMMNDNQSVAEALFLHMVGHRPRSNRMNLPSRYSELLGKAGGDELRQVPVLGLR